jgi:crotonobetaine/carnitine-CoA ligase
MKAVSEAALIEMQQSGQDVPWLLGYWASNRSDHPALIWDPPGGSIRVWSYAELYRDAARVAAGLAARGIAKGDHILLHADNSPEFILSWLGAGMLGAISVTTNTRSVTSEMGFFIEKARCVAAITQPEYADMVAAAGPHLDWIAVTGEGSVGLGDRFSSLLDVDNTYQGREIEPAAPFCIMFTSGTTSRPKAVVHTHANSIWASRNGPRNVDLHPDDRYLIYLPLFHTNAQSWSFFSVLGVGATAVVVPKWSTSRFWEVVVRHDVTHISLMQFCLEAFSDHRPASKLRVGVAGALMADSERRLGIQVYSAFGMTETVTHALNGKPYEPLLPGAMGRVAGGYEMAVVDSTTGRLCGEGDIGELWLRGTAGIQMFLEYFDNSEANDAAFEDGWFKTGDRVELGPGGNVFYRERNRDLLKVGGENVSAEEVEEAIQAVPCVAEVAVVGKRHEWLDQVVVAFVIVNGHDVDRVELEKRIMEACRSTLAAFKVPRAVYFVEHFPRATLDKILKNKLRELADAAPPLD